MIALDTNLLVYAESIKDAQNRHHRIRELIALLSDGNSIIPLVVFGEFFNVCRKKKILSVETAIRRVERYAATFQTPSATEADLIAAALLADRHDLQFFDALIVTVASRAGATILLSEDMQDGLQIDNLQILNPFNPANLKEIVATIDPPS